MVAALAAAVLASVLASGGCGRIDFHDGPPDAAVPDARDASVIDPCAATYTTVHGLSRYRDTGTAATWDIAEQACEADGRGSHLVVFNDTLEMHQIEADVSGAVIWLGITDRVHDGTFVDVMGASPAFLPQWQSPDPSFPGPGCVEFNPSSRLIHDLACGNPVAYVCECDGIPAQPSSY